MGLFDFIGVKEEMVLTRKENDFRMCRPVACTLIHDESKHFTRAVLTTNADIIGDNGVVYTTKVLESVMLAGLIHPDKLMTIQLARISMQRLILEADKMQLRGINDGNSDLFTQIETNVVNVKYKNMAYTAVRDEENAIWTVKLFRFYGEHGSVIRDEPIMHVTERYATTESMSNEVIKHLFDFYKIGVDRIEDSENDFKDLIFELNI